MFASLAEEFGRKDFEIEVKEGMTIADAWEAVAGGVPMRGEMLMAVNMDYSDVSSVLKDGDEVAFFPPISGGSL